MGSHHRSLLSCLYDTTNYSINANCLNHGKLTTAVTPIAFRMFVPVFYLFSKRSDSNLIQRHMPGRGTLRRTFRLLLIETESMLVTGQTDRIVEEK
jgi:hypothetical protein